MELKFRVWNPDQNKFIYFELDNMCFPDRFLHQYKKPVQISTGLKDKKGKEIFVGDIILICYSKGHERDSTGDVYGNFQVVFEHSGFVMIDNEGLHEDFGPYTSGYYDELGKLEVFEVVGNIFENKDLLE